MREITKTVSIPVDGKPREFRPAVCQCADPPEGRIRLQRRPPVSINVTASGTDPEAVGRNIYDAAERYLLRTLEETL